MGAEASYLSCEVADVRVGQPLPCTVYLYLDFRFITFRAEGDVIDSVAMDRFTARRMRQIFVRAEDAQKWAAWIQAEAPPPPSSPEEKELREVREDLHRAAYDIFSAEHPNVAVTQAIEASKKLVDQVMKHPYAVKPILQLQAYSQGAVGHSVNVSVLSTYLAMQMGYSHAVILQNVAVGALLHDIGKSSVPIADEDDDETAKRKMLEHPELGGVLLDAEQSVPNEVKWIVLQHHEHNDGTGYPKGLRGNAIYDLTRIVAIANWFDERVSEGPGTLIERQRAALKALEAEGKKIFDPIKLEKALKILRLGI